MSAKRIPHGSVGSGFSSMRSPPPALVEFHVSQKLLRRFDHRENVVEFRWDLLECGDKVGRVHAHSRAVKTMHEILEEASVQLQQGPVRGDEHVRLRNILLCQMMRVQSNSPTHHRPY
jgi:hypothetical protein